MDEREARRIAERLQVAGLTVKAIFDDVLDTWCVASGVVRFADVGMMPPKWLEILRQAS